MIVAADTSALAKLLVEEAESARMRAYLAGEARGGTEFAISTIAVTELRRLAIRLDIDAARVEPVVRPFRIIALTEGMLQLAGRLPHRNLGTLDAVHLSAALSIEAAVLLTYDDRQIAAAEGEGLTVASPGRAASSSG